MPIFIDLSGRSASPGRLRLRAAIAIVVVAVVIAVVTVLNSPDRSDSLIDVTVTAPALTDGVTVGADVKYHGLRVGTVTEVSGVVGRQSMTLRVERSEVTSLTQSMSVAVRPSNLLGTGSVELSANPGGARLGDDTTVRLDTPLGGATTTGVLRRAGALIDTLDSDQARALTDLAIDNSRTVGTDLGAIARFVGMLRDDQLRSTSYLLRSAAGTSRGLADLAPGFLNLLETIVERSEFFGSKANQDRLGKSLSNLSGVFFSLADFLTTNAPYTRPTLESVLSVMEPVAYSAYTANGAYADIGRLIDNVDRAFVRRGDSVSLRLRVVLQSMPYLARSVAPRTGGAPR